GLHELLYALEAQRDEQPADSPDVPTTVLTGSEYAADDDDGSDAAEDAEVDGDTEADEDADEGDEDARRSV
ncbi:MAG: hypothetical protein ACR2I8_06800, partial [Steroidobacteraceae bacterium]